MRPVWRRAAGGAHISPARPLHSRGTGAPAPRTAGSGRGGRGTSCTWLGSRPFRHKRSSRRPSAPPRAHAVSASCPSRDAGAHGARARTALTPPESVNQPGPDTADAVLSAKGLISPCGQQVNGTAPGLDTPLPDSLRSVAPRSFQATDAPAGAHVTVTARRTLMPAGHPAPYILSQVTC